MTQKSFPQDDVYPIAIDGGPYTAAQDAQRVTLLKDKVNGLDMSINYVGGSNTAEIKISSGMCIVDGTVFISDYDTVFNVTWTEDMLFQSFVAVVISNRSTNEITKASDVSPYDYDLWFPDDLIDYEGTATIKPGTVRLALIVEYSTTLLQTDQLWNDPGIVMLKAVSAYTYDKPTPSSAELSSPNKVRLPHRKHATLLCSRSFDDGVNIVTLNVSTKAKSFTVSGQITQTLNYQTASNYILPEINFVPYDTSGVDTDKLVLHNSSSYSQKLIPDSAANYNSLKFNQVEEFYNNFVFKFDIRIMNRYMFISGTINSSKLKINYGGIADDGALTLLPLEDFVNGVIYFGHVPTTVEQELILDSITVTIAESQLASGSYISIEEN